MASTQYITYKAVGNREGLVDRIAELFADDVPAFKMAMTVPAVARRHQWTQDSLAAASNTGSVEGATVTYSAPDYRVLNNNSTQIKVRSWDVTRTQEAVAKAGVKSEVARETMKALKEIAKDFDKIIVWTAAEATGQTGTARVSRGLLNAVTGNIVSCGSSRAQLTEDQVNQVMDNIWTDGGNPGALFCNGFNKRVISKKFTAKTGFSFNIPASARKAISNINDYEGSFGTLQIIPDRHMQSDDVAIVSPEFLRKAVLRDIEVFKGAQVSSSIRGWVEAEMCLEWGNQSAHGKITDTTTGGAIS